METEEFYQLILSCIEESNQNRKADRDIISYHLYNAGLINDIVLEGKDFEDFLVEWKDKLVLYTCYCIFYKKYDPNSGWLDINYNKLSTIVRRIKYCDSKQEFSDRLKTLKSIYVEKYDLCDAEMIHRIIRSGFKKEDIDGETERDVCELFAKHILDLVQFLSGEKYDWTEYDCMDYFNKTYSYLESKDNIDKVQEEPNMPINDRSYIRKDMVWHVINEGEPTIDGVDCLVLVGVDDNDEDRYEVLEWCDKNKAFKWRSDDGKDCYFPVHNFTKWAYMKDVICITNRHDHPDDMVGCLE